MRILLLAGTYEARQIALRLGRDGRIDLTASLAGVTREPLPQGAETRVGGFGGREGQQKFMSNKGFDAVLDATHPFANRISYRTQSICAALGVPYLQVLRPGWSPEDGDRWTFVPDEAAVAPQVAANMTVFLGTGPGSLEAIGTLPAAKVICRRIDPPDGPFPWDNGAWRVGRPPFTVDDEIAFFREEGVDLVVVKNAGGRGGWAKLEAARALGLPVVLIDRPMQPPGEKAETVEAALDWIERL
ncbi:cobalt-precorrin-6A reductase [Maritimibacter sp. UBA3975]|uniref:cobalt-precorrin-6A reductase n=1 Tax=Maritimibacter sp. UBA3975 TaxID=1946833 RepID=UPI000C0A0AD0|nr:cobalt-precorrin-6A reductase [Maritimibacter sp. UBA3975]MAM60331.1 cobalt-precorrin-6A reductase [Maritimibacter sp.]|tara:strand:- start:12112 stop:12843 length:732 start_codon:yes stop_codon:yes gene_type:complete